MNGARVVDASAAFALLLANAQGVRVGGGPGAAASLIAHAYSAGPRGLRGAMARAARAGASRPGTPPRHASPYPGPARSWRGRAW